MGGGVVGGNLVVLFINCIHKEKKKKREVLRTSFAWRRDAPQEAKAEAELRLKRSFSEYMVMVINHQNKVQGKG